MNVIAMAFEYILAGLLALCAFVLPFLPRCILESGGDLAGITAIAIGLSYLAGMVFDKAADAILGPLEQWLRLQRANKHAAHTPEHNRDPFPQDALEFSLRKNDGALEWMNSLRSRIRCARALAVFSCPAAMGIAVFLYAGAASWPKIMIVAVFGVICVFAIICKAVFPLRKTGKPAKETDKDKSTLAAWSITAVLILAAPALATAVILNRDLALAAAGVLLFDALSVWTWIRVTRTYLKFIHRQLPELRSGGH